MEYQLSPSDLTFLYDGCKHCFVLKVKHGIPQPSIPIPGVFSAIANLQKNYYSGRRTEEFCPALPPGLVTLGEQRVRSAPVTFGDTESACRLAGRFDIVARLDDGSYAILDFKTGNSSEQKADMYGRQLHAYAIALENPAENTLGLSPVSRLGLLYFSPDSCEYVAGGRQLLGGPMTWVEIKRDDESFKKFLREVVGLLDGPLPSPSPGSCDWCRYRARLAEVPASQRADNSTAAADTPTPACPTCGGPMRLKKGQYGEFWGCAGFPACRGTRRI
jgi:hypothetical protein